MTEVVEVEVVEPVVEVPADEVASVQQFPNGWNLVTFGVWQVGISEDGLIRLPFGVGPDTVGDLIGALKVAGEVAAAVQAENEARAALENSRGIESRGGLVVRAGPPPAGAMRLPVTPRLVKG